MTSQTVQLTDAKINTYNEQLMQMMNSINQELQLIIEDELFDKLSDSIGVVGELIQIIAKMDVMLCYS